MSRSDFRAADRRGKRRTKPPVPHVKAHLPGDSACHARQAFLMAAVDRKKDSTFRSYMHVTTPCSPDLHPEWAWSE